jgi:hypothetical protein
MSAPEHRAEADVTVVARRYGSAIAHYSMKRNTARLRSEWELRSLSLLTIVGLVGRCCGVAPRPKTSMLIMRPPQHGHFGFAVIDGGSGGLAYER